MKIAIVLFSIMLSGFAASGFAAENPACLEAYKAEVARIMRDAERAAAANPPGSDVQAQQKIMKPVHDAMKAAADRADQCERKSRASKPAPAAAATVAQRERDCMETAENKLAALNKRYAGRSPSAAEQATIREEEGRIVDARMACMRLAR